MAPTPCHRNATRTEYSAITRVGQELHVAQPDMRGDVVRQAARGVVNQRPHQARGDVGQDERQVKDDAEQGPAAEAPVEPQGHREPGRDHRGHVDGRPDRGVLQRDMEGRVPGEQLGVVAEPNERVLAAQDVPVEKARVQGVHRRVDDGHDVDDQAGHGEQEDRRAPGAPPQCRPFSQCTPRFRGDFGVTPGGGRGPAAAPRRRGGRAPGGVRRWLRRYGTGWFPHGQEPVKPVTAEARLAAACAGVWLPLMSAAWTVENVFTSCCGRIWSIGR